MKEYREVITSIIKALGISANLKGYYYLRYAIELMTKVIYPKVAERFDTTPLSAERAIRHAIETGWNRANVDFSDKLFGYTVEPNKAKPTNSEFIATVADYILLSEREKEVQNNV